MRGLDYIGYSKLKEASSSGFQKWFDYEFLRTQKAKTASYFLICAWSVTSIIISLYFGANDDYGMFRYMQFAAGADPTAATSAAEMQADGLGVESQPAEVMSIKISHWYVQVANLIFLISNVQMDILYLRIMMVAANIFLFLWGGFVLSTALDVIIYSSVNILINIVFSIPLILARIPIKFDLEMEDIYIRFFSSYLNRQEFQILIKMWGVHIKRRFQVKTKLITQNNPFEGLILFTSIPKSAKVIIGRERNKISTVTEGQWIGVPEMLGLQNDFEKYEKKLNTIEKNIEMDKQVTLKRW